MKPQALITVASLTLAGCTSAVQTRQQPILGEHPVNGHNTTDTVPESVDATAQEESQTPKAGNLAEAIAQAQAAAAEAARELTIRPAAVERLTPEDYREVANRLNVEPEAVMAVVEVEAGRGHQGFHQPGKPVINFDLAMFKRFTSRSGIDLTPFQGSHPNVFNKPTGRYSLQGAQYARYDQAADIDEQSAVYGTFWGMFQIGGFNWKLCGTNSYTHFVELMSRSERDQLDLFANLITACGFDKHLRARDWTAFARNYNGPGYATRSYHKRLAAAYRKFKDKSED